MKQGLVRWCILSLLVLVLAGCSGSNTSNPPTVSGVAAAGSVLVGTVYLKDSSVPAKELSMSIAADGSFLFDLSGMTAPYILKATGTANGRTFTLYSFAPTAGIANINPLSSLAVTLAYGNFVVPVFYNSPDHAKMLVIKNSLSSAIANVQAALRPTLTRFGAEEVNFVFDPYVANHQGLDLFLDNANITANDGVVTLSDMTSNRVVQTTLGGFIADTFDFIPNPVTTVGTVCIFPAFTRLNTYASKTFTANVIGSNDQSVTWSVVEGNGGSITNNGVYTAPATAGTFHVKATSTADSTRSATAAVVIGGAVGSIQIVPSGPGEYTVMASNFSNVGGVDVTITYDTTSLVNPRITQGSLLAGAVFVSNLTLPGSVKFAAMSLRAISGCGTLATITFDLPGAAPNIPVIKAVKLAAAASTSPPISSVVPVPPADQPPPASAGGSVPATRESGSTAGISTP
jgi:hypothetical protein